MKPLRTGVFICSCGPNIGDRMDLERLGSGVSGIEGVALVQQHSLLCSPAGKSFLEEAIRDGGFDRVVIAACSPRDHLGTFMDVCRAAGTNPFMMQMVNVREQCAWITDDRELATDKALRMIRGAVARSALHRPLEVREIECSPDVVVIGAGAAGLRTALSLASTGRRIFLLERTDSPGGRHSGMPEVREMAERAACCGDIEVMTGCEPEDIRGFFGNFLVTLQDGTGISAGAVVLATGSRDGVELLAEMGYGDLPDVRTSAEATHMLDSDSLAMESGSVPRRVAIVDCAGRNGCGYCSVVCCDDTLELAGRLSRFREDIEVTVYHGQVCTSLGSLRAWRERLEETGCRLVDSGVTGMDRTGEGLVPRLDTEGAPAGIFDMVILQAPRVPAAGFDRLASILRTGTDPGGFPLPEHDRLSPVTTAIDGVYLAGSSAGPCRIGDALIQADAVAGTILSVLVPGRKVSTEPCVSVIPPSLCRGCRTCMEICVYGAISWSEEERVCSVNTVLCRGCGGCAAACPSGAPRASHFTSGQLRRQVVGVLE